MLKFADAREVLVGPSRDATCGPVIAFGTGGIAVEAIHDTALALPPLNLQIATNLINATRVSRILGAYRSEPAIDEKALVDVLMRVSAIACLLPWIREMDLNPVHAHPLGAAVVDARIVIDPAIASMQTTNRYEHMAIHPYPMELERLQKLKDGATLLLRANHKIVGVARYPPNSDRVSTEFAVTIGDEWQARGLGAQLMRALIECL